LASFTTVTFTDAVFSAGDWDFFPANDATGRSVPHNKARVRRWIFMACSYSTANAAHTGRLASITFNSLPCGWWVAESKKAMLSIAIGLRGPLL
jgi:hypothetical protein